MIYQKEKFAELAAKMADEIMSQNKSDWRGQRKEGRKRLESQILDDLNDLDVEEIDDESEDCEMISEGAWEMFGESWANRN